MCQEQTRRAAAGDESWDLESSTDSDSCCTDDMESESEADSCAKAVRGSSSRLVVSAAPVSRSEAGVGPAPAPAQRPPLPKLGQTATAWAAPAPVAPAPAPTRAPAKPRRELAVSVANLLQQPDPARTMAKQLVGNAQTGGLMQLISHLRGDNARLREALVAAQRETEALVAQQQESTAAAFAPGVDFGHLLELVRDFGADGLGGSEESLELMEGSASATQVFCIDSPRSDSASESESEMEKMRRELEDSRAEVAKLREELAAARGAQISQ